MRPLQPLVEIFRQPGGAGRALPSRHKTHPASTFGGPRLVRRPLGIIHVTDVYVVFGLRRYKFWLSRAPGYLGTRDEKSGLVVIAAQADGPGIGRIRMRMIKDASAESLHSKSRGKLFFRLMQQAVTTPPATYDTLVKRSKPGAQPVGVS